MKLAQVNSYKQTPNLNVNPSFNGKLDKSGYRYIKSLKKEIAKNSQQPNTEPFQVLNEALQLLENFAKKLHPDTKIEIHRSLEPRYCCDFDGASWWKTEKYLNFDAKNPKTKDPKTIAAIYVGEGKYYFDDPSPEKFLQKVKDIVNFKEPQKIDNELFECTKNNFLNKVKENQKPSFITRFFARREAKKLDKIAPEFHSTPNTLQQVNSHINTWSDFYKEANK